MIYLLFSDDTWTTVNDYDEIEKCIARHWWPFPLDIEGDPRRTVKVLMDGGIEIVYKKI